MIDLTSLYQKRADLIECINKNDIKKLKCLLSGDITTIENENISSNQQNNLFKNSTTTMNLNFVDRDGQTPLHRSCLNGNLNIVKLLVENGSSQNIKNKDGWFPIHIATYFGHLDIVMFLINEKNFNKDSFIDVFDDEKVVPKPATKFSYFNKNCLVYRSDPMNNDIPNDYEDHSSSSDDSSSDEDDYDDEEAKFKMDNNNNTISSLINGVNNESFYLNDFNLDELKNLDLNDLNNLSFDLSTEFLKL
jgi:ankyrin repeat protein